jgi:tetratricopeptide (TPR) repeat protein
MNLNFVFKSPDHLRYENGKHVSGPHGGAGRAVKVEPNISGGEGYTVTLYNLDGNHPVWQNNIQMAPKQMKLVVADSEKIQLKGYGRDAMGASFADYGLTIYHDDGSIEKCVLHMYDRGVDIEYLKLEEQSKNKTSLNEIDFTEEIKSFLSKFQAQAMSVKTQLASETDRLNNLGVDYYENNDIDNAIKYYNKALEIYPINDDALKNLIVCYREIGNFKKMQEAQNKLDYLRKIGL